MFRLLYLFVFGVVTVSARHVNFYRKDYTYIEEYDAFYKLHWDESGRNFSSSFLSCDDEGAELFYPNIVNEWLVAKKMVQEVPDAPNVTDILVGIHDKFGLGEYITLSGHSTKLPVLNVDETSENRQCVTMEIETGTFIAVSCEADADTSRPYICRKVEEISCPTIDKGYTYVKETKKCYKLNRNHKTWSRAMETCYMEGGLLVVLESEMEAEIVTRLFKLQSDNVYFAGFKTLFPNNEYYTIKGHKLQDSGYYEWYSQDNIYECGILWNYNNNLYLTTRSCEDTLPFICEMAVPA